MKFLHIADCHLGSAMESHLPREMASKRRNELLSTFADALRLAVEKQARAVLIAGDLFDTPHPDSKTVNYVLNSFVNLPDIDVILIEGNHDIGALTGHTLPVNVHLVPSGESAIFPYEDTIIYAAGYPVSEEWLASLSPDKAKTNILLLHGSPEKVQHVTEDAIPLPLIENKHIDILALGHYHSFRQGLLAERGVFAFSGVPEGRGFDEEGDCGALLWDMDTPCTPIFCPLARRKLHRLTLDITQLHTQVGIEEAALELTKDIPQQDMVHLTLCGECRAEDNKDAAQLTAFLSSRFYFTKVKDKTRLALHAEDYIHDISLRGEFVRRVLAADLEEEERQQVLRFGLRALAGEEPTGHL